MWVPPADSANQNLRPSADHQPRNIQICQLILHSYLPSADIQIVVLRYPGVIPADLAVLNLHRRPTLHYLIHGTASANSSTPGYCLLLAHQQAQSTMACLYVRLSKSRSRDAGAGAGVLALGMTMKVGAAGEGGLSWLGAPLLPQQLAVPLLPQQQQRTIMIAMSESDYETDLDDGKDGSWSSEEISGDENVHPVEVKAIVPPPPPPAPIAPPIIHPIPPIQKTVSNQTNACTRSISRAQIHHAQAQANTQATMEKAAAEAQRHQDVFAKLPVALFQDLERGGPSRTRSAGLLTQLLNLPLEIFLANHPYSKSAAALPISSQVQVGSVVAMPTGPVVNGNGNTNAIGTGWYRPKGRPQGQELEDDSGSEDKANAGIQVSKSVAQEWLEAFAQQRGIVIHGKQKSMSGRLTTLDDNIIPPWLNACGQLRRQVSDRCLYPEEQPPTPTPIPIGHSYNLPPPTAPSTPRMTCHQMLQTEMSESLSQNLLWERQVSKVNPVGYRASTNGGSRGNVLGGLKLLTTTPSMVQLRAKGEAAGNGTGAADPSNADQIQPPDRERRGSGGEAEEREERRWLARARNKSWADDYHFKGW
ncbi:uncharacterized protein LACBIDRAFT_293019 [Laccaria bicolor S238N-H82]|uniref:Predicted protein n=1 Tax=Laccaria bicolor (strain S238N-H82 / ATCC MYA-4686) TaxID=486041 RepID=B0D071_LACBS|nr:uncharacterized protein LACBIDRAFT_293019 [Laccaria bicolor S238N-H82]EDR11404.1 predicted protein [Laccaria bicolor S238N-H82]|eukprot:XP_001877301.1 predicted protein [Laccaria bicolor S238N-H82]